MLKMHHLALGDYQTNCYIIHEEYARTCAILDPGYEPERVLSKVSELGLTVEAILLTHAHFDHVGGVKTIAQQTGCKVYLHEADRALPPMLTAGPLYDTEPYADGDTITVAGLEVEVIHTPGHTPGSVCLLADETLFSGDTLFARSCGRTDLGGSWPILKRSLMRLTLLDPNLWIYPGHGEMTTLFDELNYNPYLRGTL